ncbi:MAG: undecaprenyl-diphosphate phosphatase [Bdellovibrionales bacterium]|nr:undecaprenyl-diphosphate phosphatase [Bdellovibrionales bacterium]
MELTHGILLAIVEGLTEFLPVSSTGHIILTSTLLGINEDDFVKNYTVIVQFGAIASVLVLYWQRFFQSLDFYKKLVLGFLPAGVVGLSLKNIIDDLLGSPSVVAWALVLGGIALIILDRREYGNKSELEGNNEKQELKEEMNSKEGQSLGELEVSYRQAFFIGLVQCLAFVPGVSRSAATIMGGIWQGLDRKTAAEFSFLLAVPTLTGATAIKLLKIAPTITNDQLGIIVIGNLVAFVVGYLAIRLFIYYVSRFGFEKFGWYRIILGSLFILFLHYS